jgi:hypothetical protein
MPYAIEVREDRVAGRTIVWARSARGQLFIVFTKANDFYQAGDVIQMILDHGKLRPPDILAHLHIFEPKSKIVAVASLGFLLTTCDSYRSLRSGYL